VEGKLLSFRRLCTYKYFTMARISPSEEYKIISAPFDSPLFEHVRRIRIEVFVDEQKYPLADEFDDNDPTCIHVLLLHRPVNGEQQATPPTVAVDAALEGYEPAGTLRCLQPPKNKVGRVAVLKKFRGKGLGGVMMKGLEAMLRGQLEVSPVQDGGKPAEIVLHAQGELCYLYYSVYSCLTLFSN
jgi:predicted GNAT family N-acyltransferase